MGQHRYNVDVRPQRSFDESNGVGDHSPGGHHQRPVGCDHCEQSRFGVSGTMRRSSRDGYKPHSADEFTMLIVTQQAYAANTKVMTTANSMVQDLVNVLR